MIWKETLRQLELKKDWDTAIEYMQHIIHDNPDDMDAYIYMNFLLMNLLVEEDHSNLDHDLDYYARFAKYYFDISYSKYCNNAEYLFYTAITAFMSEWYFDLDYEEALKMYRKAYELEPDNSVYQLANVEDDCYTNLEHRKQVRPIARVVLQENSPIKDAFLAKGAIGEYLWRIMSGWAKKMLTDKIF